MKLLNKMERTGTGLESGDLAAGSAIIPGFVYNYYVVFLLFGRKYAGTNMGSVQI